MGKDDPEKKCETWQLPVEKVISFSALHNQIQEMNHLTRGVYIELACVCERLGRIKRTSMVYLADQMDIPVAWVEKVLDSEFFSLRKDGCYYHVGGWVLGEFNSEDEE